MFFPRWVRARIEHAVSMMLLLMPGVRATAQPGERLVVRLAQLPAMAGS